MDDAPARYAPRGGQHLQLFGDSTLYCESSHGPEDVLYSGSEDDYYDSPAIRKLRYEAEARRFLRGRPPVLLSTTLVGPFTKESGWNNPWKGKGARRQAPQPIAVDESEPELQHSVPISGLSRGIDSNMNDDVQLPETLVPGTPSRLRGELSDINDWSQSVLPSPPVSNNPYMDDDSLARVQSWRENIESNAVRKDEFWLPASRGDLVQHGKKRQPSEEWLRRKDLKRRKPDVTNLSFADSPSRAALRKRRQQQFRSVSSTRALTPNPASSVADVSTASRSFGPESWMNGGLTASQTRLSSRSGWPPLSSLPPNSGRHQSVLKGLPIAKTAQLLESSNLSSKANSIHSQPNYHRGMGNGGISQSPSIQTGLKARAGKGDLQSQRRGSKTAQTSPRRLVSKSTRAGRDRSWNLPTASQEVEQDGPANLEASSEIPPQLESQQDSSFYYHIKTRTHKKQTSTAEDDIHDQEPIESPAEDVPVSSNKDAETSHDAIPEVRGCPAGDDCDDCLGIDGPTIVCFDSPIPSRYSVVKDRHSNERDGGCEVSAPSNGKDKVPRTLAEIKALSTDTPTSSREEPTPADGDMVPARYEVLERIQALDAPCVGNICENEGDVPASADAEESVEGDTTLLPFSQDIPQTYAEVKGTGDLTQNTVPMEKDQANHEVTQDPTRAQWPLPGEFRHERQVSPGVVSRSSSLSELPSELVHELEEMNKAGTLDQSVPLDDGRLGGEDASGPTGKTPTADKPQSPRIGTQCQSPWTRIEAEPAPILNPDRACALDGSQANLPDRNDMACNQSPVSQSPRFEGDLICARSPPPCRLPAIPEDIQGFYRRSSRTSSSAQQNPWQEQQEAAAQLSRRQNMTLYSPLSVLDDVQPSPATPSMPEGYSAPTLNPTRPSTPEMKPSSLPTPDFTFSIRSLRRFMSPDLESPRPARTHKHLKPALSNSWTKAARIHDPARRVRFVSFPGDDNERENDPAVPLDDSYADEDYIESGLPKRAVPRVAPTQPRRAASPPPNGSVTNLPSEVEKFREHYAAVASRRTARVPRVPVCLLPSDGQLVASSPSVEAMAERFLEVDAQVAKAVVLPGADEAEMEVPAGDVTVLDNQEETPPLDDVAAVLQNLDEFLGSGWDLDEEVARARDASNGLGARRDRVRVALEANVWI